MPTLIPAPWQDTATRATTVTFTSNNKLTSFIVPARSAQYPHPSPSTSVRVNYHQILITAACL